MRLELFRGRDLTDVFGQARRSLGDDAMIADSRVTHDNGRNILEVVAAEGRDILRLRRLLAPNAPAIPRSGAKRPFIVAVVGPTGGGKTTTAAKIAVHPDAFGRRRVGFLTLDTYRAGAIEQLQGYADAADLPLEVVYDPRDIDGAMKRLATCEVIVVDTPGRGPRTGGADGSAWRTMLRKLRPDETHLVIPATSRQDLAASLRAEYAAAGASHVIVTKLDEVPTDAAIAQLTAQLDLPTRWITDGQDVPADLGAAGPRVLATLAVSPVQLALA